MIRTVPFDEAEVGLFGALAPTFQSEAFGHTVCAIAMTLISCRMDRLSRSIVIVNAKQPFLGTAEKFGNHVEQVFGSKPRVVIDCTGIAAVLEQALSIPRKFGVLVLLGDTGTPANQHLTPDVLTRGVRVHGCHISHETPDWYEIKIHKRFFDLVLANRFSLEGLNTHRFLPQQAVEAYGLTTERRAETMGVWFDWR